jgi:hypothetical protein
LATDNNINGMVTAIADTEYSNILSNDYATEGDDVL